MQAYSKSWAAISQTVRTGTAGVSAAMKSVWSSITISTASTWNTIKSSIQNSFSAVKSNVTSATAAVKSSMTSAWNAVKSLTTTSWNGIKSVITTSEQTMAAYLQNSFFSNHHSLERNQVSDYFGDCFCKIFHDKRIQDFKIKPCGSSHGSYSYNHTSLRGEQQATIHSGRLRCEE